MKARAPKASPDIDPAFARVAKEFSDRTDVTAGKLMASYGLKVNGKIFAMHGRGRFVVKLPKPRVDWLVGKGAGLRFEPVRGRPMREWIVITGTRPSWIVLAKEAYVFVKEESVAAQNS